MQNKKEIKLAYIKIAKSQVKSSLNLKIQIRLLKCYVFPVLLWSEILDCNCNFMQEVGSILDIALQAHA